MVEDSRKWSGSFMLAYIGHTLGYVSSGIAGFAISLWLSVEVFPGEEQKAALSAALSAVNLAIALPTVLGAPIAGSWVDRHDRKGTLLASTAGLAGIYGVAAALMMSASRPEAVGPLIILIALRSIAAAFENSAFDASCAMLLPVDMLPRANGLIQTAIAVSNAASPALAGAVMTLGRLLPVRPAVSGEALVLAIASLCAAASLPFLAYARIPSPRRDDLTVLVKKSVWKDATEGLKFIRRRSGLLWLLLTFALVNLASGPLNVLLPLFIKENLMDSADAAGLDFSGVFGVAATVFGVGGIAGGLLVSASGGFRRKRIRGVLYPLIISQAAMTLLGLTLMSRIPLFFRCWCSRDRAFATLAGLGKAELEKLARDQEMTEVRCHFCNEVYQFSGQEISDLANTLQ